MARSLRRSLLYVPAINARALDKARTLPCDGVIIDLEDSVGPEAKDQARADAVAAIKAGFPGKETALRCNALSSPWGAADIRAAAEARPDVVVLPKVSEPETILAVARGLGHDTELWAMIETCMAILRLSDIVATARTAPLGALVVGSNDLAAEMRCQSDVGRGALVPALSQVVIAARALGLTPLDGPYNDFRDPGGLDGQCRQAAELGFDGKTLIHPTQIEPANRAFSPSAERIAWARAVIAAFKADPGLGVLSVDGRMVERMHLAEAERIIAATLRAG